MKCPGRDLLFDPRADADRTAFTNHAASCADCRELLALHRSTHAALGTAQETRIDTARVWSKIDTARRRPRTFDWRLPLSAAVLLASAAYIFTTIGADTETIPVRLPMEENTELNFAGAWISTHRASELIFDSSSLRKIRVVRGSISISETLAQPPPLDVETPRVRILAIGAKYQLEVEEESTRIRVESGEVTAILPDSQQRTLKSGDTLVLEDPKPVVIAPPVEQPKPKHESNNNTNARDIAAARALIGRDDKKASALAERVLERKPNKKDEVEALMIAADAHRRSGELDEAEQRYDRVVRHSAGAAYREEAMLRRASVLSDLSRASEALRILESAPERGNLRPERVALEARLRLENGDVEGAARVLDTVRDSTDRVLTPIRRELEKRREK